MEKYTIVQDDHEFDNKTEIGNKTVGGMAVEPYQYEDIEEAPPSLDVRDSQIENNDGVNNSEQGREGKFKDNIEGKFNEQGMVCEFCERAFGTFFALKYHWCYTCPELGLSDRKKFI